MKSRIEQVHGPKVLKRSALRLPGGEEAIAQAMRSKGYRTALEIGTYRGCTTAAMAQWCERVVTIDLKHGYLERDGVAHDRAAFWEALGITNIEFRGVWDDTEKAAIVAGLDFDFAFIDGGHDAESVRRDFDLVRRCGRVLFHDYDTSGRPGRGYVRDLVDALPVAEVEILSGNFALWEARR